MKNCIPSSWRSLAVAALLFLYGAHLVSAYANTNSGIDTPTGVDSLPLAVEGLQIMTLTNTNNVGSVGIGTISPGYMLEVDGAQNVSTFGMVGGRALFYPSSNAATQGVLIDAANLASGSNMTLYNAPSGWTGNYISANLNGVQQFAIAQNGNAWFNGKLDIENGTGNALLCLNGSCTTSLPAHSYGGSYSSSCSNYSFTNYYTGGYSCPSWAPNEGSGPYSVYYSGGKWNGCGVTYCYGS